MTRRTELAEALTRVRERIATACRAAGRAPTEVTLIAVTKTFPASDVALLAELGVRDVGENRDDEARDKATRLRVPDLHWHFVGKLQRNKCRSVATYADVVHSVDRPELVEALARVSQDVRRSRLGVLIQVNLDAACRATDPDHKRTADRTSHVDHSVSLDPTRRRGGVAPDEAVELLRLIARHPSLMLHGVMGIAPESGEPSAAFSQLREVSERLIRLDCTARWISAGMSGDLVPAIAAGATHVRVGSALLGIR